MELFKLLEPLVNGTTSDEETRNNKFYRKDAVDFIKWGSIGFVGMGVYQLGLRLSKRGIKSTVDLVDRADSLGSNPIILDAFVNLQSYRSLDPWLFRTALQNVDHLLFLENALMSKRIIPARNDKAIAFSHFRMSVIRLNQFQFRVKDKLGNAHAMAVNMYVKKIYKELQKHLLNILHFCSQFNPGDLIARAQNEIDRALERYDNNTMYGGQSLEKWETYKK